MAPTFIGPTSKGWSAGAAQPGAGEAQGDLIRVPKSLTGGCREAGARLCSVVPSARPGGPGHSRAPRRLPLSTRQHFCAGRVAEPWHRLPREAVGSPPWGSPEATWTWPWAACSGCPCLGRGGTRGLHWALPASAILCFRDSVKESSLSCGQTLLNAKLPLNCITLPFSVAKK